MSSRHVYLVKDNGDLCCHCRCDEAYITFPPQMDCPWCGCGWLFTCIQCRKAFTFARAVEVPHSWEDLARSDLAGQQGIALDDVDAEDLAAWVAAMQELHEGVEVGKQYACFDGLFIPTDVTGIQFQGWHSEHNLDFVPQVRACEDYSVMEDILGNQSYWLERTIPAD